MPGYPIDAGQVNQLCGTISRQIDQWAPDAIKFQQWLLTMTEAELTAPPFNFTTDDVAVIKSSFNDLSKLANVYLGRDTAPDLYDFGQFSRRLAGLYV